MKDLLNYYYYIITDRINMQNHNYYFNYLNHSFCLYRYDGMLENLNDIFKLNTYMLYNNYKINKIILNRDSMIATRYGNYYYVLILLRFNSKTLISLNEVVNFERRIGVLPSILNRTNWIELWCKKIDNIEYSIKHLMHKFKLIYNSIYYYIGLTENAITYLSLINVNNQNISIEHQRVKKNTTIEEFFNPLNLIIDFRIRDLAEYLKSCFFERKWDVSSIINYLKKIPMSNTDYLYFYIRMLFPSYYFDLYDLIIAGNISEESILKITSYQEDYEYLLYEIYLLVKSHINIVGIEWINRKFAI